MGVIEKVFEYRPLPPPADGPSSPVVWPSVEVRRVAPSADGLVEYRQVLHPGVDVVNFVADDKE